MVDNSPKILQNKLMNYVFWNFIPIYKLFWQKNIPCDFHMKNDRTIHILVNFSNTSQFVGLFETGRVVGSFGTDHFITFIKY